MTDSKRCKSVFQPRQHYIVVLSLNFSSMLLQPLVWSNVVEHTQQTTTSERLSWACIVELLLCGPNAGTSFLATQMCVLQCTVFMLDLYYFDSLMECHSKYTVMKDSVILGQGAKWTACVVLLTSVTRSACTFLYKQTLVDPVLRVFRKAELCHTQSTLLTSLDKNVHETILLVICISYIWGSYEIN